MDETIHFLHRLSQLHRKRTLWTFPQELLVDTNNADETFVTVGARLIRSNSTQQQASGVIWYSLLFDKPYQPRILLIHRTSACDCQFTFFERRLIPELMVTQNV